MTDVVISGIGGLFPNSGDLETLGRNILANEYLVQRHEHLWLRDERVNLEPVGGRMPHHDRFDNTFFGMPRKLATWVDPLAVLGYERCFEAILDAGVNPHSLRGTNTHVYAGTNFSDNEAGSLEFMKYSDGYAIMGHSRAMNSNRVSYYFDFNGKSCAYDAGDAFGQLGLAMALEAISTGETDAALVVAATTIAFPNVCQMYQEMGILSRDALCHPFEGAVSGTHRSESCVAFLVQRADLAKRSYCRIVASNTTHLGARLRFDPTLPNPAGIQSFLTDMYRRSGVDPRRVAYVEGDGVGLHLQDTFELDALDAVLGKHRSRGDPLLVGCVKSNTGHTEVASGMVGIAKCVVAMEHGVIPATINHAADLPCRALAEGRMKMVTANTPFKFDRQTYLGVSSHSMTGLFGHTILSPHAKPKRVVDAAADLPRLVLVSARSEAAARLVAEKIKSYSYDPEYLRLVQDVFGPTIRGYEYRSFVICPPEAKDAVKVARVERQTLWFVYSGMGSQWAGMGEALMRVPAYAETIERLHAVLEPKGIDLKTILSETGPSAFDGIMKSFVGITASQIALTNVLTAVGLRPDGIIGHSVGELGCAYADGCLTEEQAILAAWARGRASSEAKLVKGMMAAIGLGYKEVLPRLPPTIEVACHNSSTSCTLSGPAEAVERFVAKLSAEGVFARAVNVSDIAYHSTFIQPAAPFLRKYLEAVIPEPKKRSPKWVSTSVPLDRQGEPWAQLCSAEYQTNNLLSPVLFEEGLTFIPKQALLIEVAPHGLLQAILKRALPDNTHLPLTQRGTADPVRFLLGALGTASFHGQELDVAKLYPPVSFPVSTGTPALSPLVSWSHDETIYYGFKFRSVREGCESLELTAHSPHMSVNGSKVLPPVEELESAWRALGLIHNLKAGRLPVTFHNIRVNEYQRLPEDGSTCVVTTVSKGTGTFEVRDESTDSLLITGTVRPQDDDDSAPRSLPPSEATGEAIILTGEEVRTDLASKGLVLHDKYGGALLSVRVDELEWTVAVDGGSPFAAILEALVLVLQYRASEEATGLVLMQRWRRVDVDPIKLRAQHVVEVRYNLKTGEMLGEGLYATGFHGVRANSVALQPKSAPPAPLNFTFVPYGDTKLQSVGEFLSLAVQLTMESVPPKLRTAPNIRILELQNCSGPNVLGPAIRAVLQERMGVDADVRAVSVRPGQELVLPEKKDGVFLTVSAPTTMAEAVRVAAHVGGLLLTKSKSRLSPNEAAGMAVVAEQCLDGGWVSLLRAPVPVKDAHVVNMSATEPPPRRIPEAARGPLVLVWRGQPDAGVPRVVDEVRRRPYAHLARLVFVLDKDAPQFSLSEPMYTRQLALQLQVNVLRAGTWGCWQAIPLVGATPAVISATSLEGVAIEAYSLNPRVGGDPAAEAWSGHLDYAGVSADGKVMGVARWLADNSRPRLDHMLRWPVPSDWGVTEAVTVPYTYATVYHALMVTAGLRRGESVLVHQGASALGQAAIRVALQLGAATVFTTVDNEAQKKLVRRLFPQLDARNVLSCVDGSTAFEWHIRTLTQQRGVNVVLSTLPGEQFKASLRCTRPWGRVLHLGRQDMLASNTFGLQIFLSSVVVQGMSGDQLFLASERDRRAVHRAVQQGLESGAVQPIEGARTFCSPSAASIKDALWGSGAGTDVAKVVLLLQQNGVKHELAAKKSFVVVGGQQQEWLQVTSLLSQHGAREILAVSGAPGAVPSPLVRHRQRALRRLFGTNLRVEGVAHWDEAAARRVLHAAPGPVHSVVVIAKEGSRVPALLHRALGLAADAPGLLVLCERADTACGLTALCEARRAAGLRAACLSGPLASVAEHLADLLTGTRPAVTLLDGPVALDSPGVELHTATPRGVPAGARALAELARRAAARGRVACRVRELPSLGLRTRHTREALPVFVVPPLGAMDAEENDALAALALRVVNPVMVVEAAVQDDLALQAACAAEAIEAVRSIGPFNVLSWGLGTPLALEVARQLERRGHHAVTFLVDGNVQRVQSWAAEQSDVSLLRAAFSDDKSQEVLESAAGGDLLESLLRAVDPPERPHTEQGFLILRTAMMALARHSPNVRDPVTGRVVEIQADDDVAHCFSRSPKVSLRRMPRGEAQLGLRSPWLANVLTENTGYSKETTMEELRPLLLALKA